jgi:hypothetical protein
MISVTYCSLIAQTLRKQTKFADFTQNVAQIMTQFAWALPAKPLTFWNSAGAVIEIITKQIIFET